MRFKGSQPVRNVVPRLQFDATSWYFFCHAHRRKIDNVESGNHNRERRNYKWQNGNVRHAIIPRKGVASRKYARSVKKKARM